jgi:hypothetical protein
MRIRRRNVDLTSERPMIDENKPLEEALLIIQAEVSKALDARLKTVEAKLDQILAHHARINEMLSQAEEAVNAMMENPLLKQMISGGFGGFPGFGG